MPNHRLPIKLDDLDEAFENGSDALRYYLDLETGAVVLVSDEVREALETIYGELNPDKDLEGFAIDDLVQQRGLPDWMHTMIQQAHAVDQGYDTRFLAIPEPDSHENYRDMERFIDTVSDQRLRRELERAIQGRGAFRRFKDTLRSTERERWFAFNAAQVRERVLEWLEAEQIELIAKSGLTQQR